MFLHHTGQCVEVARTAMPAQSRPFRLRFAGCGDRLVNVGFGALGNKRQHFARGGVLDLEGVTGGGELAVDEMAKTVALIDEPGQGFGSTFRGGAIIHGFENLFYGHGSPLRPWNAATRPNSAP